MIWHIFRKDLKLLWRMVIGVALINLVQRVSLSSAGPFFRVTLSPQVMISGVLEFVALLATGVLIVSVVQEDPIPGLWHDWLVRPIRRRDLLLSKILFVALLVQAPILVIEVIQCLAAGFPLGPSLAAPLSRSLWMFLAMDLPVLAFATLTRTLTQATGAAIAAFLVWAIFNTSTLGYRVYFDSTWLNDLARVAWGLAVASIVLALQYRGRKVTRARWIYGGAALVWTLAQLAPLQSGAASLERISSPPIAAAQFEIAFDPASQGPPRQTRQSVPAKSLGADAKLDVWVPMRVSGLSERQALITDAATAHLIEPDGTKIDLGPAGAAPASSGAPARELIWVPENIYSRWKHQPVRLELDYALTLMRFNPQFMPASGGDQWIAGLGHCATRISAAGTMVELGCLAPGSTPCLTASVEYDDAAKTAVIDSGCRSGYAPFFGRIQGDSISRLGRELPLIWAQLKDARVMIAPYHPEAHFTRQVVIPNFRLGDWSRE